MPPTLPTISPIGPPSEPAMPVIAPRRFLPLLWMTETTVLAIFAPVPIAETMPAKAGAR